MEQHSVRFSGRTDFMEQPSGLRGHGTPCTFLAKKYSSQCFSDISLNQQVLDCLDVDSGEGVKFSSETLFVPDKYDIV